MARSTDTGLKDVNGTYIHLNDHVVYRYNQAADDKNKAISIDVFGTVKEYRHRDDDINLHDVLFEQEDGKSWVIHEEDQQLITVIHDESPRSSK